MNQSSAHVIKCCYARGEHTGKWIVQSYEGGTRWSDDQCSHYITRKEADSALKRLVRNALRYQEDV